MLHSRLKIEFRKWERPAVRKQPLKNAAQWTNFSSYVPLPPDCITYSYVQRRVTNDSTFVQCDADLITTVCLILAGTPVNIENVTSETLEREILDRSPFWMPSIFDFNFQFFTTQQTHNRAAIFRLRVDMRDLKSAVLLTLLRGGAAI